MKAFSACVFIAALVTMTNAAPTTGGVDAKSLGAPAVPLAASTHQESSFDKGAQQASSSSGQGSFGYDHGAQAAKTFGNKESSGSKENFAFSSNNAFNQGSGHFSHSGGFNHNDHLAQLGSQHQSLTAVPVPGFPVGVPTIPFGVSGSFGSSVTAPGAPIGVSGVSGSVTGVPIATPALPNAALTVGGPDVGYAQTGTPLSSGGVIPQPLNFGFGLGPIGVSNSAGSLQTGSAASGFAQGQGAWNYNQGQSSVNSSGNKETFANKESFGQESSASHANGAGQNSHAQNSQSAQHDKGHQLASNSQVVG